jgi:hypothetical protein
MLPVSSFHHSYSLSLHNRQFYYLQYSFLLSLEVMGSGGSLLMFRLLRHTDTSPIEEMVSWQAAMATAADSCDRTMADLISGFGDHGGGGGTAAMWQLRISHDAELKIVGFIILYYSAFISLGIYICFLFIWLFLYHSS